MQKMSDCICEKCGKTFQRRTTEHTRNLKLGRRVFCSGRCSSATTIRENMGDSFGSCQNSSHLSKYKRKGDEFTPFRYCLKTIKGRPRGQKEVTITLRDLKDVWDSQDGICPFTGQKMIPRKHSRTHQELFPNHASLDRINNNLGYVPGNVRFISVMANFARNVFTDQQLIDFCKQVAMNHE